MGDFQDKATADQKEHKCSSHICPPKISNQIKSLLLSHHHSTCALVSEILESVLQTVQKQFTYRQYILTQKTMCRMHIHIVSTHSVISWLPPWLLGKYSMDWWDKSWTFWKLCVPLHVALKPAHYLIKRTSYQQSNMVVVVVVWWSSGPGWLAIIDETMNSALYQKILKVNVWPSVCGLKLMCTWVMQQDNDPKHTSKSTSEWLKKTKLRFWSSQVKVRTSIQLRCCGMTINSPFMLENPPMWLN